MFIVIYCLVLSIFAHGNCTKFPVVIPQILPFDFGEEAIDSGDTASLTCTVHKGDMPVDIIWLRSNKTIANDNSISVMNGKKVSTLNIDSISSEHAGVYTCVAKNLAGSSSHSATLNVNGI